MIFALLKEKDPRIAITLEGISTFDKWKIETLIENDIKKNSKFDFSLTNNTFDERKKIIPQADILITFNPLNVEEIEETKNSTIFISRFAPYDNPGVLNLFKKKSHTVFSLDMIPRITVAQSCDVLSSLASLSGYKAVILAANHFSRYLPMLTTAAGTIAPAKVMVIGAGVAGLQAIATAKRLGAVVSAFDTRIAAKTEVMSLGANFIEVEGAIDDKSAGGYAVEQSEEYKKKQREEIYKNIVKSDIVITTAQIRAKRAPQIIDRNMVMDMNKGSVIVDLASATGGNCELTQDEKTVVESDVTIIGNSDLSRELPYHASILYSRNVINFLKFIVENETLTLDMVNKLEHQVAKQSCIIHRGKQVWQR